ncbi:MAG: ATP-dependent helicase [Rhodospirillaceae bacterium]|nr:ATP-dependent helicase [Rhodospirillaceae bacterium]
MIGAPGPRLTAVLGPTNTGKTYLAVERMLGHESGMIGFPLRLLARENYDRIRKLKGERAVALVTGEEKILPPSARYFVCTVESMPLDRPVGFLAVDEVQMAADPERGHIFTDRLLHARGQQETMLLGADTMRPLLRHLLPGLEIVSRPRFSTLSHSGPRKPTRLPPRSAVVAFSAAEVYRIAEMMRRQRGGCAVVMGALSPRTRNAQVEMYQAGEVDHLVATDAIGMGLNMDLIHVAFAGLSKFDGRNPRRLTPAELAQIAGRAGRHMNDGTFGTTAEVGALAPETVEAIENHRFDAIRALMWRNSDLDFRSIDALRASLEQRPPDRALIRAREAEDQQALAQLALESEIVRRIGGPATLRLLWEVCQIPDFRKVMSDTHARLLGQVFRYLTSGEERLPTDWVASQVARLDQTDGDIDTLMARIAHIRTWTYIAHRAAWLADPAAWQERTRAVEDKLSDALHRSLTQRFVDRRQALLLRRMKDGGELEGAVTRAGEVIVEGHAVGQLSGFRFIPDGSGGAEESRPLLTAARRALTSEIPARLARLEAADDETFALSPAGVLGWEGAPVGRLIAGETVMSPRVDPLPSDLLDGNQRERLRRRLALWLERHIARRLKPLIAAEQAIANDPAIAGATRGVLFQLIEALGLLPRRELAAQLPLADAKALGRMGVRLGRESVWFPALASAAGLTALLWCVKAGRAPAPLPPRRPASLLRDPALPADFYHAVGYRLAGALAVRADALERLSQLARGLAAEGPFQPVEALRQAIQCESAALPAVIAALGYRSVETNGELRFHAPDRKRGRAKAGKRRWAKKRPRTAPDSPFAALRDLKLRH